MQAGLMLPGSVRGDSGRKERRGRERERQREGDREGERKTASRWQKKTPCVQKS